MKPPATTNPILVIAADVAAIAVIGPQYIALSAVLWLLRRRYRKNCKVWN